MTSRDIHLRFCVTLAQRQMEDGRYLMYEHPKSAASWINPSVDRFASTAGVMRAELDQCEFGLMSEDELGQAPAKKPTPLLTNSVEVDRAMEVKCKGGHRHVQLMAGRARAAAHYPVKCSKSLCKGIWRQTKVDASGMLSTLILEGGWDEVSEVAHVAERSTGMTFLGKNSGMIWFELLVRRS